MFDIRVKKEISLFRDEEFDTINEICFTKTGRFIFAGTESSKIKVWDVLGTGKTF